jgi:hypothetical protein
MGEFKFACPVCGQHITADSSNSGSEIECPTCYRKIVVPQAPTEGQKFILSAAEVSKPRPASTPVLSNHVHKPASASKSGLVVGAILLIGIGAAAFFIFQKKNSASPESQKASGSNFTKSSSTVTVSTSSIPWKLDLTDMKIPEANASGRIHGRDFNHQRAILQGSQLTLRHGTSGLTDLGVSINLPAQRQGEAWSGQSVTIDANRPRSPRAQLRWKDNGQARTANFTNGYAMRLEFGAAANARIPGKIYLCMPDNEKSVVAGTFDAEIRQPAPPKPKTPKQPPKPKR